MQDAFERIAIVNRGEAAMRFIHAVREYNREYDTSLRTIALYTEPDRHAMFVREADDAVSLGPAQVVDPQTSQLKSSYVAYDCLGRALGLARAEAAWVGWGFVAEHAEFADLCREIGVVFIGPDGDVMRQLGDKITSKLLAEEAGIPVAPWSRGPVETLEEAWRHAHELGFPLLIKASAGGGGHGIRRVNSPGDLPRAFDGARSEAFKSFGDPTVFMEQLVQGARHVEVQIIADRYGNTWAAGVRDCTIQRRHQKILEEAPSPVLSPEQDHAVREAAVRLSRLVGYSNAGTVEFLYEPQSRHLAFMEMNTRLQVEHPVTECTTGLDLVKLQIHVARGGRLEGDPPRTSGHAIEVRLNAEDSENHFAPAPGLIERFRFLTGPGVRIDTGVAEGDSVPAEFDSMIAKIIACGQTRREALARLERALRESSVVINGGTSNKAFLLALLNRDEVRHSTVDIGWLDRVAATGHHLSSRHADVALVHAAIQAYADELAVEQTQFFSSALRGRPQVSTALGRTIELRYRANAYSIRVLGLGLGRYRLEVDGVWLEARLDRLGPFEYWLRVFGQRFQVVSAFGGLNYRIEVDGVSHQVDRDDGGFVRAPSPAVVVSISVKPGDIVAAGDSVAVLEAMKMEMHVSAPFSGRVRQVMAIPHVQVAAGTPLLQMEIATEADTRVQEDRVAFDSRVAAVEPETGLSRCLDTLQEIRQLMLGFDADPTRASQLRAEWNEFCAISDRDEIREREDEILAIFVDICSLFHRMPEISDSGAGETPSAESSLLAYLRMIERRGEGLPAGFLAALRRALAHYGIHVLDRSPELEESLLRIYKSHARMDQQAEPIVGLLERRLANVQAHAPEASDSFRALLERVVYITRGLFPSISDLAREVRYRYFDQPLFEQARNQVYRQVEEHLHALDSTPDAQDRQERMRALIECPQPLTIFFSCRFPEASHQLRQVMLQVLLSRYYCIRSLAGIRHLDVNGRCWLTANYEHEGGSVHAFTTEAPFSEFAKTLSSLMTLIHSVPADDDIVADLFLRQPMPTSDPEAASRQIETLLNQAACPRPLRRIVVAITSPGQLPNRGSTRCFTYRHTASGYREEKLYRGLHPMIAKRLHFWRLANFNLERLPSVEDIYLVRATARENPKDQRLIAFAEVRDITPVRNKKGRVIALPHLERVFTEAAAAMRFAQARRSIQERLHWNRIFLYVWPPLTLQPDESNCIVNKLASAVDDLGLEQVVLRARIPSPRTGELRDMVVRISNPAGAGLLMTFRTAANLQPMKPLTEYDQKVVRMRQRGLVYPYEVIKMLTPPAEHARAGMPPGNFIEHDLNAAGRLVPVDRSYGQNKANVITGVICNFTRQYPEGMKRVILLGDPSKGLGALAEPECRRIIGAIDLAEQMKAPVEWFAVSAGAKIAMDSGVENMDWIARVLRRIVTFTQAGGEINLIIDGINVGAQPYWNAEATMLMHTRGILIMTPKAAMVLTGKRALDYSGSVSAEDNHGIGGYDRIMGVNGQAQYWARDLYDACGMLLRHYDHSYIAPGELLPRRAPTNDPPNRDVRLYPHNGAEGSFALVGDIFSDEANSGRKKSFDIRKVMRAVSDQDHPPLERWPGMRGAELAVVWDVHLSGYPVCLIGIESRPLPRLGFVPGDGPDLWTAGTLFPLSSKKVARAINAASNNRPVVILANLSGFDGSPESMRKLQLEYGAEIGRAIVNFRGPVVFCVISRYHGGAYVVFSRALNENLEVAALEGTFASVIGGAPAAAVVFASEVEARTRADSRLQAINEAMAAAGPVERGKLRAEWNEVFKVVHSEQLGRMAAEFDAVHSVQRALDVGALDCIIPPAKLRPYLIEAVERGIQKLGIATADLFATAGAP